MISRNPKIFLTCLFLAFSFLSLLLTTGHAQVTLTVGKGSALPDATNSPVAVNLDNPDDKVTAVQLDICDDDDFLRCTGCEKTARAGGFSCSINELDGCCRVVIFSLSDDIIAEGTGPIVRILHEVSGEASGCSVLTPQDVSISDERQTPLTVDSEPGGFCFPCTSAADCDDGLYCTGEESCSDNACVAGTNPCEAGKVCVEESDDCVTTTTTSGPSSTTTTGPSTTTTTAEPSTTTTGPSSSTTTAPGVASMEVISDDFWKSRWVALPGLVVIKGNETSFQAFKTTIAYEPRNAIFKLFPIILGNDYIWNIVLVMPSWFAGAGDQEVTVTVTTGDEVVSDNFLIQELPFILEQE